ncbi:hypothetical protein JMN32_19365 [Fulvivirga sp. 29W222]|uniref:Uncharacterized protein n=1 Tax=Fulvivirga marina TaxID=2494733 RepID=A0A937FYG8_9BACT|nr:hypothetical protein [Fulvivirga marina]MBL6448479.1 hypothetical protein [Fulvivirga marina]
MAEQVRILPSPQTLSSIKGSAAVKVRRNRVLSGTCRLGQALKWTEFAEAPKNHSEKLSREAHL